MEQVYVEIFPDEEVSEMFAVFGFILPFIPELIYKDTSVGYLEWLTQGHLYLLNQQIKFLRKIYLISTLLQENNFYTLLASDFDYYAYSTALELRFVSDFNNFKKKEIAIYILGRVSIKIGKDDNKRKIYHHLQQLAHRMHTYIQQTFPLEYTLRPLSRVRWPSINPISLRTLLKTECTKCTAEIRRYTDEDKFPYPLLWSQNTYSQLLALLLKSPQTLVLSISLQPEHPLRASERNRLQNLAVMDRAPVEIQGISGEFIDGSLKRRQGPKASAADYYLRTLHKPFLLRIQVLSNKPIGEELLQAIGEEISPTQDAIKTDASFFGLWPSFRYIYPAIHELKIALDNFKYIKRLFWGNDTLDTNDRLLYLFGATEANAAFRIPLPSLHGIPGVDTIPFNPFTPFSSHSDNTNKRLVKLGVDIHGQEFTVNVDDFTKHVLIVGSTGSGKTTTSQRILFELWKHRIPFWVIEPAKSEYRYLLELDAFNEDMNSETLLFTLGGGTSPFTFNPFEVPPGVSVGTYISALKTCFMAAFPLGGPLNIILEKAIREVYQAKGWQLFDSVTENTIDKPFPTLFDLYQKIEEIIPRLGYSGEIKSNLDAALRLRVGNMLDGILGQIFVANAQKSKQIQVWSWKDLLTRPVIFEMESIADDDEKALIISILFVVLSFYQRRHYERRKSQGRAVPLRHVTLIEEAHRLFANPGFQDQTEGVTSKTKAIETFTNMLAEMRAYGEGLIIAEQIPAKLYKDIIKHPNLKIMHRITSEEDRTILGSAMNFSEQHRRYVTTLRRGTAAIYLEGLYAPILVSIYPPKEYTIPVNSAIMQKMAIRSLAKLLLEWKRPNHPRHIDEITTYLNDLARRLQQLQGLTTNEIYEYIEALLIRIERGYPDLSFIARDFRLRFRQKVGGGKK